MTDLLPHPQESRPTGPIHQRLRLITTLAFLGFFLMGGAWAIAMPWDGGPDEQAHITRAAGVAGGQFAPRPEAVNLSGGITFPGAYQDVPVGILRLSPACFAFKPQQPATCLAPPPTETDKPVRAFTTAGRYPPTYYALVGLPLRWWPNHNGLVAARLISAALSAGFLACAVRCLLAWSRRPFMLAGLVVAATPMVMHLAGVINPNGLEVAAAIAMWAALIPLILGDDPVDRRVLVLAAVSAAMVAVVRPAGSMYVALTLAVLLGTAGRRRIVGLARNRGVWLMLAVMAGASLASGIWTLVMKVNPAISGLEGTDLGIFRALRVVVVDRISFYLKSMVGIFGWVDTEMPNVFYAVWFAMAGFLAIAALAVGRRGDRWRLTLTVVAAFVVPVLTDVVGAKTMGPMVVQGRYILASAVGAALLAAYIIGEQGMVTPQLTRSVVGVLAALALPAQFVALAYTMIRYQHGVGGTVPAVNPLNGPWHPLLGSATALVTAALGLAALASAIRLAVPHQVGDATGTR